MVRAHRRRPTPGMARSLRRPTVRRGTRAAPTVRLPERSRPVFNRPSLVANDAITLFSGTTRRLAFPKQSIWKAGNPVKPIHTAIAIQPVSLRRPDLVWRHRWLRHWRRLRKHQPAYRTCRPRASRFFSSRTGIPEGSSRFHVCRYVLSILDTQRGLCQSSWTRNVAAIAKDLVRDFRNSTHPHLLPTRDSRPSRRLAIFAANHH